MPYIMAIQHACMIIFPAIHHMTPNNIGSSAMTNRVIVRENNHLMHNTPSRAAVVICLRITLQNRAVCCWEFLLPCFSYICNAQYCGILLYLPLLVQCSGVTLLLMTHGGGARC